MLSSVDSLASTGGGIVIQVLGELSNRDEPSQKFAETFFLAEQPNGYFVLNDIFRYLKEDVESDYDGTDPDPPADVSHSTIPEGGLLNHGLANGFHSNSNNVSVEQLPRPMDPPLPDISLDLQPSSDVTLESHMDSQNVYQVSAGDGPSESEGKKSVGVEQSSSPQSPSAVVLEPESSFSLDSSQPPPYEAQHDGDSGSSEPAITQAAPPARSWATLAATNSEKWHAPQEQRPPVRANPSYPKVSSSQSNRKDFAKSASAGNLLLVFLPL